MVKAKPGIPRPAIPLVVPERIDRRIGIESADGVDPALVENAPKQGAALRLQQRVVRIGVGGIDVLLRRYDIVVAGEHDGQTRGVELRRVRREPLRPGELVVELGTRLRIAVRCVERGDQNAVHCRGDVAALLILRIAGKRRVRDDRLAVARKDGHAIPGFLPAPDGAVSRLLDRVLREFQIRRLQFLQTDDFRARGAQPVEQIFQPLVDVVDVESGDLHLVASRGFARCASLMLRRRIGQETFLLDHWTGSVRPGLNSNSSMTVHTGSARPV